MCLLCDPLCYKTKELTQRITEESQNYAGKLNKLIIK